MVVDGNSFLRTSAYFGANALFLQILNPQMAQEFLEGRVQCGSKPS